MPPQVLEVNPKHPLVQSLFRIRESPFASVVAAQLLDNALVTAGLVEDARYMIPRLNDILMNAIGTVQAAPAAEQPEPVLPEEKS